MEKLRHNTAVKILIAMLLALFIPISVFGSISVFRLSAHNAYKAESFAETDFIDTLIDIDENLLQDSRFYIDNENASVDFKMAFAKEYNGSPLCNCVITVTDPDGNVILQNYEAPCSDIAVKHYTLSYGVHPENYGWLSNISSGLDNPLSKIGYESFSACPPDTRKFINWLFEKKGINTAGMSEAEIFGNYPDYYGEYCIEASRIYIYTTPRGYYNITVSRTEESIEFLSKEHFMTGGYRYRHLILILALLGSAVSLALGVLLFLSALYPLGEPGKAEKIPFELFLIFSAGIALLLYMLFDSSQTISYDKQLNLLIFIASVYLITLFVIWLLYSVFIRLRRRDWWKYTLVYSAYSIIDWFLHNLSDVLAVLLGSVFWVIANILLTVLAFSNAALGVSLLVVFNLIAITFVVMIAAQWRKLKDIASNIAEGNTEMLADTDRMLPPMKTFGEDLNKISTGMETAIEEQIRSERMKTDLITNVSHDLKTPLTSIVSYVGLLKKQNVENETAREYIDTLDRQSVRLGRLIEDLVEASKVTSGNVNVVLTTLNAGELLEQAISEYQMRLDQCMLTPVLTVSDGPLTAVADGRLLWRVFDNLLSNACKYALTGTRLYIDAFREEDSITVVFRNVSAQQLNIPPEELMERFVRGDSSRSTSGSGLGLTIAKSLTELQGGEFSLEIDGDLFKAYVTLPLAESHTLLPTE